MMDEAVTLFREALAGTGIQVRAEGHGDVVFYRLDPSLREAASYRFSPSVYHRIDPFLYGVRLATGFEAFCNEVVQAVVALPSPPSVPGE